MPHQTPQRSFFLARRPCHSGLGGEGIIYTWVIYRTRPLKTNGSTVVSSSARATSGGMLWSVKRNIVILSCELISSPSGCCYLQRGDLVEQAACASQRGKQERREAGSKGGAQEDTNRLAGNPWQRTAQAPPAPESSLPWVHTCYTWKASGEVVSGLQSGPQPQALSSSGERRSDF